MEDKVARRRPYMWVDSIKGWTAGGLPKFNMQMQDRC